MSTKQSACNGECCGNSSKPKGMCTYGVEEEVEQPVSSCTPVDFKDLAPEKFNARYYLKYCAPALDAFLSSLKTREQQVYGHLEPPKLHSHQNVRNVPKAYPEVYKRLKDYVPSRPDLTFEQLHDEINSKIRDIMYIGDLAVYDISLRIGWNLPKRIKPERLVYMHQGTRVGAELLLGREVKTKPVSLEELKDVVAPLTESHHIEDFLCLYHIKHS